VFCERHSWCIGDVTSTVRRSWPRVKARDEAQILDFCPRRTYRCPADQDTFRSGWTITIVPAGPRENPHDDTRASCGQPGFFPRGALRAGAKDRSRGAERGGHRRRPLSPKDTKYGSVESLSEAKKCADLFKANREKIDGILVTLPNFGDERGIADTIRLAGLDVPVLVHAFPDEPGRMAIEHRRDSFCGKMSACNNLTQYGIRYSLTTQHTVDPESAEFRGDLASFAGVCRIVRGCARRALARSGPGRRVRGPCATAKSCSSGRGSAWKASISPSCSEGLGLKDKDSSVVAKLDEIRGYVRTTKIPRESLTRMAKFSVVLDQYVAEHELSGTAIQSGRPWRRTSASCRARP